MSNTITLTQLAASDSPVKSTVRQNLAGGKGKAYSFSMPSFLYYALKAKQVARFKCASENEVRNKIGSSVYEYAIGSIRDIAKSAYAELSLHPERNDLPASSLIQSRILNHILDDPDLPINKIPELKSISINSSRSGKNITTPSYLLDKLSSMLGNEQAARSQIHEITFQIKTSLTDKGFIDSNGKLTGPAAASTWSRKLHNAILLDLIKLSNIPELGEDVSMIDVQLNRDFNLEI